MQVWYSLDDVPAGWGPSAVAIGNFDGVHRGHQAVLSRVSADAAAAGLTSVALTFDPHPARVHRPAVAPELITGLRDRLELMAATGLDSVLVCAYSLEFARQTPEEFVRTWLVEPLTPAVVVLGRDVRFGRDNSGDLATMRGLGERFGFRVEVVEDVAAHADPPAPAGRPDAPARRWSSSWVRELLAEGDVVAAARVLGRPHRLRGVVVHGDARGRELGYPTANLDPHAEGAVPADGVYAGWLRVVRTTDGTALDEAPVMPCAVSIGTNPTFDGVQRRVEAYVLDRTDLQLYDAEVVVELVERLRPTLRFDSVDALLDQMAQDVARVRDVLTGAS